MPKAHVMFEEIWIMKTIEILNNRKFERSCLMDNSVDDGFALCNRLSYRITVYTYLDLKLTLRNINFERRKLHHIPKQPKCTVFMNIYRNVEDNEW